MADFDTTSYWIRSAPLPQFPPLARNVTVDVAVIGGGVVGITTAYLLKAAGLSVAVLERGRCAHVDTGHTTAHLTMVTDLMLTDLVSEFSREVARAMWDAGRMAIDQIESHIRIEEIECDFRRVNGYLHEALTGDGATREELEETASLARDLGFEAAYELQVPFAKRSGVRFPDQALLHPLKYLGGLLRALAGGGCYVFESTEVNEVVAAPLSVRSGDHTVTCDYVVIATHTPIMGKTNVAKATVLQSKLALYSSYVLGGRLPAGQVPCGLYWDTTEPYHYLRVEPRSGYDYDYAVFGGEDHKTGQVGDTRRCYAVLEETAQQVLPSFEIADRWSGQVIETNDGLPYIGETSDRQFVATGFAGNGWTFGTLGAMMARDAVLGRSNPWADLLSVNRTKLRGGTWNYLTENNDYLYYIMRDRFAAAQGAPLRVLRRGEGKILNVKGQRTAAYRDEKGVVHTRSAICTHMGCEVKWNQAEKTWDCPCHGSRFHPDGPVLAGPAESPLPEIENEARNVGVT